jgi:hypothetical protein
LAIFREKGLKTEKMIQKIEQTTEEQIGMYLELPKQKLAEMLVEANRNLNMRKPKVNTFINMNMSFEDKVEKFELIELIRPPYEEFDERIFDSMCIPKGYFGEKE